MSCLARTAVSRPVWWRSSELQVDAAFAYCQDLVREGDKDRFFADLFSPAGRRPFLFALHAFNLEIARAPILAREPLLGEMRLQWWRDALAAGGRGEGGASPVAAALQETLRRNNLDVAALAELIDARSFDLYRNPMQTIVDFEAYARRTSSTLMRMAAHILGCRGPEVASAALHAGIAVATANLLRSFPFHASRGALYIPVEILAQHGASVTSVLAGQTSPELLAALADMRERARAHLAQASGPLGRLPPDAMPAFLTVSLVRPYLKLMDRPGYDPFRTPADLAQWRRQWILWRAARRPRPLTDA